MTLRLSVHTTLVSAVSDAPDFGIGPQLSGPVVPHLELVPASGSSFVRCPWGLNADRSFTLRNR